MTRSTLLALAVAAFTVPLAAQAQTAAPQQQVEVVGSRAALPDAATLSAMTGHFALSDGRTLRVMHPGLNLMVAVGKGWARTVEPIGPNRFATRDGRLEVAFDPGFDSLRIVESQRVTVAARGDGGSLR
jgi:hypothetical protein